jgi:hypothetical protein
MIQVQVILDDHDPIPTVKINVLKREDWTEVEADLAIGIQDTVMEMFRQAAKNAGLRMTETIIDDTAPRRIATIGDQRAK